MNTASRTETDAGDRCQRVGFPPKQANVFKRFIEFVNDELAMKCMPHEMPLVDDTRYFHRQQCSMEKWSLRVKKDGVHPFYLNIINPAKEEISVTDVFFFWFGSRWLCRVSSRCLMSQDVFSRYGYSSNWHKFGKGEKSNQVYIPSHDGIVGFYQGTYT